jgi:beta-lactamase class D
MENEELKQLQKDLKWQYFEKTGNKAKKNKNIYINFLGFIAHDIENYVFLDKYMFFNNNDIEKLLELYCKEINIKEIKDINYFCNNSYLAKNYAEKLALNVISKFF